MYSIFSNNITYIKNFSKSVKTKKKVFLIKKSRCKLIHNFLLADTSYDGESGNEIDGFAAESLDRRSWYYNRRMIAQSQAYGIDRTHEAGAPCLAMVDQPTTPQKFAVSGGLFAENAVWEFVYLCQFCYYG